MLLVIVNECRSELVQLMFHTSMVVLVVGGNVIVVVPRLVMKVVPVTPRLVVTKGYSSLIVRTSGG